MLLKIDHYFNRSLELVGCFKTLEQQNHFSLSLTHLELVVVKWFIYPVQGLSTLTPFHFQSSTVSNGFGEASPRTFSKSERNARFPSSVGLLAHHQALAVAAANQNSRRESHDDSPMMGVVIQR